MFATLTTTMACWVNDVMTAIGANNRGKLWNLTRTLKFPKVTLYLVMVCTLSLILIPYSMDVWLETVGLEGRGV